MRACQQNWTLLPASRRGIKSLLWLGDVVYRCLYHYINHTVSFGSSWAAAVCLREGNLCQLGAPRTNSKYRRQVDLQ